MGRTLPTQIQLLRQAEEEWKDFRRALRKEDQEAFDQVWSYARRHAAAASMAARPLPFEAHALSMVVGLQREIEELKRFRGMNVPTEDGFLREKETVAPSDKPALFPLSPGSPVSMSHKQGNRETGRRGEEGAG